MHLGTVDITVAIAPGVHMPRLGIGTYQLQPGEQTRQAVQSALEAGIRLIDTAAAYGNEVDVGRAIRASGLPREDMFVTTKLWNTDHGYQAALNACGKSLARLGLEEVDLYLIHWPVPEQREETWRALERLQREGRCRAIGVSNYTVRHLEGLLATAEIRPAVDQVEFHPFLYQKDLQTFLNRERIQLEAYSPLARARRMDHPLVQALAERHGRTPAQVMIRWSLQHGAVVIPKSSHPERIRENSRVWDFELTGVEMQSLDRLNQHYRTSWNPTRIP